MKRGLSIRYKFLLVTTLLLVFCVAVYLFMATQVFRKDKKELVFDLNKSLVINLASDLDSVFQSATDKMRLAAYFFHSRDEDNLAILRELLAASQDIVYVGGAERFERLDRTFFLSQSYIETYGLPDDFFSKDLSAQRQIPFQRLKAEGEAIWNATVENGPPLIGFGKSVLLEGVNGQPKGHYAVVAFLKADRILKALGRTRLSQALVVSATGEVLARPMDREGQAQVAPLKLLELAVNQPVKSSVLQYRDGGEEYLGAFARAANSRVFVLSRVSASHAFAVVNQFVARSGLLALMVLNLAFIAAILFSRSLTRPLQTLMEGMGKVAEGELSTQIYVKSHDEIAELASSFNGMIRELKGSREALEEINRDLEAKVKERTQQLEKQNQAVKSAQEALLRTTRLAAVGEIAGRAAHEVLNPLTTILARLEKLQERLGQERLEEVNLLQDLVQSWRAEFKEGGFDKLVSGWKSPSQVVAGSTLWDEDLGNLDQVRANLNRELKTLLGDAEFLHREAQRIGRIVQAMRGLSVVESARETADLNQLVEDVANIMRDLASQHGIEIQVRRPPEPALAVIDRDEFIQATTNLVRNSIQAIVERQRQESRGGHIDLELAAEGEQWGLRIRDDGIGIAPEYLDKLFENQFSTKPRSEGTGLGLNISRRFIRAAGGDIVCEKSAPRIGTVFLIRLPMANAEEGAA